MTQFALARNVLIVINVVLGSSVVQGSSPIHRDDIALVEEFQGV
jgi:hypothetical protein